MTSFQETIQVLLSRMQDDDDRQRFKTYLAKQLVPEAVIREAHGKDKSTLVTVALKPFDEALALFCEKATEEEKQRLQTHVHALLNHTM